MNSNKLLHQAFAKYKKKCDYQISISQIARNVELPYSNVYNSLMYEKKCNAQTWLTLMNYFGAVQQVKEKIKIKSSIS